MRKISIGQRVEVIGTRDEYDKNENHIVQEVPIRWEGTVTRIGITDDQLYYAYDLIGDDGFEVKNYPSPCLIHIIPGTKRKVSKIIGDQIPYIEDDVELAEVATAINYILGTSSKLKVTTNELNHIKMLMKLIYLYGKTVGKRQERAEKKAKKKAHLTEVR